ncbi:MAG: MFS transporter [Ardenticatenaceae bacterium]|nr:MFS transporter [Ardenticatenaceae bacterium]
MMATNQAAVYRERPFLAVSLTHFFVDVLNNGRNLLVALLAVSLGLTNAQVGIALLLYNVGNALSQPLFGWLADRIGARLLVIGGLGWMIVFYAIASLAGDWLALIALTVASLGSGAFHPTGTMVASRTSITYRSRITALFFMAGQIGLFLGPVLAGIMLDAYGRPGYILLPVLALTAFASSWRWLVDAPRVPKKAEIKTPVEKETAVPLPPQFWRRVTVLSLVILASSTASIAIITFTPILFTDQGYDQSLIGWLSGLIMMGSAVGGLVGGTLGDRIAGKWVILLGLLGSVLPYYFFVPANVPWQAGLLLLAGFFGGMPHTILVIMVQSLLPRQQAMASGLALGFMFFSGAVGSYFVGLIADRIGLAITLQGIAFLPLAAVLAAIFLPTKMLTKAT